MKHYSIYFPVLLFLFFSYQFVSAQYNTLLIPDTLSGTQFTLIVNESSKAFISGQKTNTYGVNGNFLGPTLFMNKGDSVFINVVNNLADTTTMHWHGFHIPPEMDGGPHQPVPPGTTWSPYFKIMNNAATYWYHPHLHMMTMEQLSMGIAGFIIIRDSIESSLILPRTYGIDDFPLMLQDRTFNNFNQFEEVAYGDTMMVNGTLYPEVSMPAQFVRMRLLNANHERAYNLGFSDNRTFYVIASDGGLLDTPVPVTRYIMAIGERIEILVDFTGQQNQSIDLMAYNKTLPNDVPGYEPANSPPPFGNALGDRDFMILHINIGAQTTNPVISLPATLTTNVFWDEDSAMVIRTIVMDNDSITLNYEFNDEPFHMDSINQYVNLGATEIWELVNLSLLSHPFHIHDVEFYILTRDGVAPPVEEQGWKDVVHVYRNETLRFIAKFEDFADDMYPYMYHCHIGAHEDRGMMGQFLVVDSSMVMGIKKPEALTEEIILYPNPANDFITFKDISLQSAFTIEIYNATGQVIYQKKYDGSPLLPIDISSFHEGLYSLRLRQGENTKISKFIIQR